MSEFQYYEFLAVDQPLSTEQMRELRAISTRAQITPTRMTNTYTFGDFKGDPAELVTSYFDAHVYVANWGTHELILGFHRQAVDVDHLKQYAVEANSGYVSGLTVVERGDRVLVTFAYSDEDGGGGWLEEGEAEGWMPSLIQLRADILNGDLRAMYVGWLAGATYNPSEDEDDEFDEDDEEEDGGDPHPSGQLEPPVPPGLARLSAPLRSLTEFLSLDTATVAVAAERSGTLAATQPSAPAIAGWVGGLPSDEKDALLVRVIQGETSVGAELLRRIRADTGMTGASPVAEGTPRTARELATAGAERANELDQRRQASEARKRQEYLESLVGKEGALWQRVEEFIDQKQARPYDEAVDLLKTLRDLAAYRQQALAFTERLSALRLRHKSKVSFVQRLDKTGLR